LWEDLAEGALGCLVLADTRELDASHDALTLLDNAAIPYAVAINTFPGAPSYPDEEVRQALALDDATPLTACDARDRTSSLHALLKLTEYLTERRSAQPLETRRGRGPPPSPPSPDRRARRTGTRCTPPSSPPTRTPATGACGTRTARWSPSTSRPGYPRPS